MEVVQAFEANYPETVKRIFILNGMVLINLDLFDRVWFFCVCYLG
jgi:hypothetical protein